MDLPYNQENNEDLIKKWSQIRKEKQETVKAQPKFIDKVQNHFWVQIGPNNFFFEKMKIIIT